MTSKLEQERSHNAGYEPSEAGRSVASEYDYGSKRKFVDVLGIIKKDGLANLEKYGKTLDNPSQKSVKSQLTAASLKSLASSYKR